MAILSIHSVITLLFQAAVLLDKASFSAHVCDNGSAPSWVQLACSSGQVDNIFDRISSQKVIEQVKH